jgi:8-oxo-dGTP pyrophosphatase MutT (NUDIX family)
LKNFKHKLLAVMQHVVLVHREQALLLRYSTYQGKGVEGLWGLPGGHYIAGDPIIDLRREVREETGLELSDELKLLRNYVVMFPDGVERFGAFYLCRLSISEPPVITLSCEHTEYMWAARDALEGLRIIGPYHRQILLDVLA